MPPVGLVLLWFGVDLEPTSMHRIASICEAGLHCSIAESCACVDILWLITQDSVNL